MSRETDGALLPAGVVCLIGFLVLTLIVTLGLFERVDTVARDFVQRGHHPFLGPWMEGASWLWGSPGQIAVGLLAVAILRPRWPRWALALPVVLAGAALLQGLLKGALERPRPNLAAWGFPSGHVLTLVVLLGYLAYVARVSTPGGRWRGLPGAVCVATVGIVAYSRMYVDAHWLSDVLGGLSGGLAYLLLTIWLIRSIPSPWPSRAPGGLIGSPGGAAEFPVSSGLTDRAS